ncbi:hypothetical protein HG536_0B00960 [Torulaspora globosa]|uniref:Cyclin-like domain-containing protein n=1 Tax=Torulaspora globosa TaxID=48254 RepID=A0A7G3ZCJ9_9SACH|nr:uncharacterized protein HG536_0B00960 [Torulaspora globosa]QLL31235.1 hypothetical protein HG536_0B00960 [Torulaspora globosa]
MKRRVALDPKLIESERIACNIAIEPFKNEILQYLQDLEQTPTSLLNPVMIDNQPEIRWEMRPYLIDFLIELHLIFRLSQETLFLACFIADKYCSRKIVYKRHYQLLVTASLWIAAKYHEKKTRVPTLKELCHLCNQSYDPAMILQMQRHILITLEWSVGSSVSTFDMVQCLMSSSSDRTIPEDSNFTGLSYFLADLTLYQRDFMLYSSSTKAITAILLASRILNVGRFPEILGQLMINSSHDNDGCFHIMTDPTANDISLSPSKQSIDDIRACLQLYLNDIFGYKMLNAKESISNTLLRKYKHLPIQNWLSDYRSKTLQLYTQISSFTGSLKFTNLIPYTASGSSLLKEYVRSCLDEIAGFKNISKTDSDQHDSPPSESQVNVSPATPSSSFSSIDLSMSTRWGLPTPTSSRSSFTQFSEHIPNMSFTPGHVKPCTVCPITPASASSLFSTAPRLSITSRSSSFSSLPGVATSSHNIPKDSCPKGPPVNFKRSVSTQDAVPSIYEFTIT